MSYHSARACLRSEQSGFTIIEIIIALVLSAFVTTIMITFFTTSFNQYFALQADGLVYGDLATQSQRVAMVLRGATDVLQATDDEVTVYAYFSPNDAVVSLVHYYLTNSNKKMVVDITPMTANPPVGSPITAQKRTYTLIDNYYKVSGTKTFTYLATGTTVLTTPITDLRNIKQIQVTLAAPTKAPSSTGYDQTTVQVMLRNRKSNL